MTPTPGAYWFEVHDGDFVFHYVEPMETALKQVQGTYSVQEGSGDRYMVSYITPGKQAEPFAVERTAQGWTLKFKDGNWNLVPADMQAIGAVETQAKRYQEYLAKPAPALLDQPLQGTVNGVPWQAQTSKATGLRRGEGAVVSVEIYGEPLPKTYFDRKAPVLYMSVPKKLGRHPLGRLINGTLSFQRDSKSENEFVHNGFIEVFALNDTTATVGIVGCTVEGSSINGRMTVDITEEREKTNEERWKENLARDARAKAEAKRKAAEKAAPPKP
jgi:hypothetical protein